MFERKAKQINIGLCVHQSAFHSKMLAGWKMFNTEEFPTATLTLYQTKLLTPVASVCGRSQKHSALLLLYL